MASTPMQDTARVPAFLLCGGSNTDRDSAIAQLAEPLSNGHPVAVLRTGGGMFSTPATPLGSHVVVKRAPVGCLCCTAGVVFRAALFGLLHASRPGRLIVDLGPGEHVSTLEAELQSQSLGRVVQVIGRADLDAREPATWPTSLS